MERRDKMKEEMATTRSMDELGRVVIPADIREEFAWGTGTKVEVEISDATTRTVAIRETLPCCSLCRDESQNLKKVGKGYICTQCTEKAK